MKKIAVTGCNGRVGSRVSLLALRRGYTVVGIDSLPQGEKLNKYLDKMNTEEQSRFSFKQIDVKDYDAVLEALKGCEGVVHLSAIVVPDYLVECHNSNVVMSYNVLRACAELKIDRVAQASTVNVITLVFSKELHFDYFPLDEEHRLNADESYGLSKIICEIQADSLVRRYPSMRIASFRLHWVVPSREEGLKDDENARRTDLWGYVQHDSAAEAFLLALEEDNGTGWNTGHEAFFICAPRTTSELPSSELRKRFFPDVPTKERGDKPTTTDVEGKSAGFYNCWKAKKLLGWEHRDDIQEVESVLQYQA